MDKDENEKLFEIFKEHYENSYSLFRKSLLYGSRYFNRNFKPVFFVLAVFGSLRYELAEEIRNYYFNDYTYKEDIDDFNLLCMSFASRFGVETFIKSDTASKLRLPAEISKLKIYCRKLIDEFIEYSLRGLWDCKIKIVNAPTTSERDSRKILNEFYARIDETQPSMKFYQKSVILNANYKIEDIVKLNVELIIPFTEEVEKMIDRLYYFNTTNTEENY